VKDKNNSVKEYNASHSSLIISLLIPLQWGRFLSLNWSMLLDQGGIFRTGIRVKKTG